MGSHLHGAARQVPHPVGDRLGHLGDREAVGGHAAGVQFDPYLWLPLAHDLHLRYPVHGLQGIGHVPGDVLKLHHGDLARKPHHADRKDGHIDLENDGHLGLFREVIHPVHRIPDLLHGLVDLIVGKVRVEIDVDLGGALVGVGFKPPYLGDPLQFLLDLLGDQILHLLRGKARADGDDHPLADGDVGVQESGHGSIGVDAEDQDEEKGHADDNGPGQGESGDRHGSSA